MSNAYSHKATTTTLTKVDHEKNTFRKLRSDTAIHLQFVDLTYGVRNGDKSKKYPTKLILNGVSGEFRAGEMSVIIGPSGAGKTTLLNLLAGYRLHTNSGRINVNEKPRDMKAFRKTARYVLQDDEIVPQFTVKETMMFATNFKLDSQRTREQRESVIDEILDMFHLRQQSNTLISNISGGERKRVCIALELIDNPSVLLLDEPTTGLDEFSASQCIRLLKQLAESGHTIICALHSPSARLCQFFDKVYALVEGHCIYQGPVEHIVSYLEGFGLNCPATHNPADFLIDVSTKAYGDFQNEMVNEIQNGKIFNWLPYADVSMPILESKIVEQFQMDRNHKSNSNTRKSWWLEYRLLFMRFMEQMWRDKTNLKLRFIVHIFCTLILSFTYKEVCRNAKYSIFMYQFAMATVMEFFFLPMAPMLATVPRDIKFMKREYFNQWYCLSSYFMALMTSQWPMMCLMSIICSPILFLVTGQPLELYRLVLYVLMTFIASLMACSMGLLLGTSMSGLNALFLGPLSISLMIILAEQTVNRDQLSTVQTILVKSSYVTYALEGLLVPLLGLDRPDLPCLSPEIFCLYSKPQNILKTIGHLNMSYIRSTLVLLGSSLMCTCVAFVIFRRRLNATQKSRENSFVPKEKRDYADKYNFTISN